MNSLQIRERIAKLMAVVRDPAAVDGERRSAAGEAFELLVDWAPAIVAGAGKTAVLKQECRTLLFEVEEVWS